MRLQVVTPLAQNPTDFAISPDGRELVYSATVDGRTQLWLRPLDSEAAQPLAGTDGGWWPFWSPDSRSIGFFVSGQLKRIDLPNGPVQTLTSAPGGAGGAWSSEGIIFGRSQTAPLYRVPAGGGSAVEATRLDAPRQTGHRHPSFLPDGRHFVFFANGTPEGKGVYLGSIGSPDTRRLFDAESRAVFSPPDYLLFGRQGALMAQRLDLATLQPVGDPLTVAGRVAGRPEAIGSIAVSASTAGPIAYRSSAAERQLIWLDRSGRQIGTLGDPDSSQMAALRLSPDGRMLATVRTVAGNTDIWLLETSRDACAV